MTSIEVKSCIGLVSRSWHIEVNKYLRSQNRNQYVPSKKYVQETFWLTIIEHKIISTQISYQTTVSNKDMRI